MHKNSQYFPHDFNARGDQKIIKLRMAHGWEGYGVYWGIVEMMYEAGGKLENDHAAIGFSLQITPEIVGRVLGASGLFYTKHGRIGSHSVDRRIECRRKISEKSSIAGKASANVRSTSVQRPFNECSTINKGKKERKEKKERKKETERPETSGFESFWEIYPNKKAKAAALKTWLRINPGPELLAQILAAVKSQSACDQWTKDGGKFIPHPATWLNNARWEDEVSPADRDHNSEPALIRVDRSQNESH